MSFLAFLKTNLKEHSPCICMECWSIVIKDELPEHRSKHPKQVTPTFAEMKVATENDIIDLCKKHAHFKDNKCEVFTLSGSLIKILSKQTKWNNGTINYYNLSAEEKSA